MSEKEQIESRLRELETERQELLTRLGKIKNRESKSLSAIE